MKYKVGDKVRVRKDLEVGNMYGGYTFVDNMDKFKGKELTIGKLYPSSHEIIEDKGEYGWTDEMLEPTKPSLLDVINFMHPNLDLKEGEEFRLNDEKSLLYLIKQDKLLFKIQNEKDWSISSKDIMVIYNGEIEKIEKKYYLKAKDWRVVAEQESESYLHFVLEENDVLWYKKSSIDSDKTQFTLKEIEELKKLNDIVKARVEFCELVEVE